MEIHSSGPPYLPKNKEEYFDRRTEIFGTATELMNNGEISMAKLDFDDKDVQTFVRQVTAPMWRLVNGKMKLEKKEETKKRLGQSPDMGDAFVYAFAPWEKGFKDVLWV